MTVNMNLGAVRAIVNACKAAGLPTNQTAYVLATARHESGAFKYMREIWGPTEVQKRYEGRKDLGNTQKGDGKKFLGRGFVQITGRRNYADWSKRLGVDLISKPSLAERPEIAVRILVEGMKLGTFTGKKLSDYINASKSDFSGARRIINGTDKASLIAGYAKEYVAALNRQGYAKPDKAAPVHGIMAAIETPAASMALSLGDRGPVVAELKKNLNTLGYGPLTEDDLFDGSTKTEVEAFQAGHKGEDGKALKVDGIAGLRTSKAIQAALLAPKLKVAERSVPPAMKAEVKKKTGPFDQAGKWLAAVGIGGAGLADRAFGAEWQTVVAIGGLALVGLAIWGVVYLIRARLNRSVDQINAEAKQ